MCHKNGLFAIPSQQSRWGGDAAPDVQCVARYPACIQTNIIASSTMHLLIKKNIMHSLLCPFSHSHTMQSKNIWEESVIVFFFSINIIQLLVTLKYLDDIFFLIWWEDSRKNPIRNNLSKKIIYKGLLADHTSRCISTPAPMSFLLTGFYFQSALMVAMNQPNVGLQPQSLPFSRFVVMLGFSARHKCLGDTALGP